MKAIIDLAIINISAILAFVFRANFGDFVIKQSPMIYLDKYIYLLFILNLISIVLFWILGLYDKRQKRAILEEYILILGVISTCISLLLVFLFLGRLWWMSRIVLFMFYAISVVLLCLSRILLKQKKYASTSLTIPLNDLESKLSDIKKRLELTLNEPFSLLIVTFNSREHIDSCLTAVKNASIKTLSEIIIVDNNSGDGTVDLVKNKYHEVKVIVNEMNMGYSKAINVGIKSAKSKYCLIINPDVKVLLGSVEIMMDYMINNTKVGLIGAKLVNEDGSLQYSVRRFLDLRTYLYRFTPLRGLLAGSSIERYYLMQDWDHSSNRIVDWVLGGCMLVRRDALSQVGMMDEDFFIYFEDVDWCHRMWQSGWQVAYIADAVMVHKHIRASANKLFNKATMIHFRSLFVFIRKHGFKLPRNCPSLQE